MKLLLIFKYSSIIIILTCILAFGCVLSVNMPPKITGLEVEHLNLYPKQSTEIKCVVSDPEGGTMTFNWSCTDGSFSGSGPSVTWTAPNKYGDFHILVVVKDDNGNSSQADVTIKVVVNENQQSCKTCG